jgi:hypothetical protein
MELEEAYRLSRVEDKLDGAKRTDWDIYKVYRWLDEDCVIWFDGKGFLMATDGGISISKKPLLEEYVTNKSDWHIWTDWPDYEAGRRDKS